VASGRLGLEVGRSGAVGSSSALSAPVLWHAERSIGLCRDKRHRYHRHAGYGRTSGTRHVPPRLMAGRVCHEKASDLGCCPPRGRPQRSRRAGQLLAPATGHEGGLARSRGIWRTGASRDMEPVPPNERTNALNNRECPASQESPNWRTHRGSAPGPKIKSFLKIAAGWGLWTFRPRAPRSRPR
jgi:hypothetical protein